MCGLYRYVSWDYRICVNIYFGQVILNFFYVLSECGSQVGYGCCIDMILDYEEDKSFFLRFDVFISEWLSRNYGDIFWFSVVFIFFKKIKIDFEYSFEKIYVCIII